MEGAVMKVLIVCSSGGHLTQAMALREWWQAHQTHWVTLPTDDARTKLAGCDVREAHYPTVRNLPNLLKNFLLANKVLRELRPDIIFSSGAAIALPFFMQARFFNARTVYLEPVDRIESPSLSGRLVYPFADQFLVQWPQLAEQFPGAKNVGIIL